MLRRRPVRGRFVLGRAFGRWYVCAFVCLVCCVYVCLSVCLSGDYVVPPPRGDPWDLGRRRPCQVHN